MSSAVKGSYSWREAPQRLVTISFPWLQFISEFWGQDNQRNIRNLQKLLHNLKLLIFPVFFMSVFPALSSRDWKWIMSSILTLCHAQPPADWAYLPALEKTKTLNSRILWWQIAARHTDDKCIELYLTVHILTYSLGCVILSVLEFERQPLVWWVSRSPIQLQKRMTIFTCLKMSLFTHFKKPQTQTL